ncbi:MAG: hypothetical protein AAB641_02040 [Patescibacteria group bacterium]
MYYIVVSITPMLFYGDVIGVFSSLEKVVEGIKAYETKQKEMNPDFKLTQRFNFKPAENRAGEREVGKGAWYLDESYDSYHIRALTLDLPLGVPVPDPNMPGYTMRE